MLGNEKTQFWRPPPLCIYWPSPTMLLGLYANTLECVILPLSPEMIQSNWSSFSIAQCVTSRFCIPNFLDAIPQMTIPVIINNGEADLN